MPPQLNSRYTFCTATTDDAGRLYLDEREPFRYQSFPDNIIHTVGESDTLFTIAGHYYKGAPRPAGLWWIIADFQIEPIVDPTVRLVPGSAIVIPSLRTVTERIFSEDRRKDAAL